MLSLNNKLVCNTDYVTSIKNEKNLIKEPSYYTYNWIQTFKLKTKSVFFCSNSQIEIMGSKTNFYNSSDVWYYYVYSCKKILCTHAHSLSLYWVNVFKTAHVQILCPRRRNLRKDRKTELNLQNLSLWCCWPVWMCMVLYYYYYHLPTQLLPLTWIRST